MWVLVIALTLTSGTLLTIALTQLYVTCGRTTVADLGIAVSLAVAFACAALLVMRWWRDLTASGKRKRSPYNPYQYADHRPRHDKYHGGTLAQNMVQSAQATGWLSRDWERRKSEGWREVAPGVMRSPDGKTTVEL